MVVDVKHPDVMLIIYWLVVSTPLKNMKVSWDDEIPNIWKNKIHVPNHQPVIYIDYRYLVGLATKNCDFPWLC